MRNGAVAEFTMGTVERGEIEYGRFSLDWATVTVQRVDERSYRMAVHLSTRTWVLWFAVDESRKLVCLREDRM